jgi:hypothetical protein
MSDKMISVKKLKQGVLAIFALCKKPNYDQILKLIDSLAQPNELDQISSKDYGADGVGLTHAEVDALGETVKPCSDKSAIVEVFAIFARYAREHGDQEDYDIALLHRAIDENKANRKPVKTEAIVECIEAYDVCTGEIRGDKIAQLESENASLKAQHERDEKAMRVLALEVNDKYADLGCNLCPADKMCTLANQYDDVDRTDECLQILIAYAKQEVGKSTIKEQENDKTK